VPEECSTVPMFGGTHIERLVKSCPNVVTLQQVLPGLLFTIVVVAVFIVVIVRLVFRQSREAPLAKLIKDQPVTFSTSALVRIRSTDKAGGWGTLKGAGGARLLIRPGGLEVTVGLGDGFASGRFLRSSDASMWRDRVGWAGSPMGERESIRLGGFDGRTTRDWAITPREASLDEVWQALLDAGVTPIHS
jgi:hypothetical protein